MGILDDAIREHLALKRRQGAGEDELARLEDEAFGPPTRPGEPDFPEPESLGEAPGADGGAKTATAEPEPEPEPVAEAPSETEFPAEPEAPAIEAEAAPPAVESTDMDAATEPAEAEAEVEPERGSAFYDRTAGDELELEELELEFDEGVGDVDEEVEPEAPPIESLDTVEHPAPVESLDTVEHEFEDAIEDEAEQGELVEGAVVEEDEEDEEEAEDVLEETPDFLRDQPEDDELWFEQGEPKDFDF